MLQEESRTYLCGYCGRDNEIVIDPTAGFRQVLVEDCFLCCRPNVITITIEPSSWNVTIEAEFEG